MPFKSLVAALIALSTLAGSAASAAELDPQAPYRGALARTDLSLPRSRAEVIADLEVYRLSGLAQMDASESPEVFSSAYAAAQARYQAMRASPDFMQRVARIARERGEVEATARTMPATSPQ